MTKRNALRAAVLPLCLASALTACATAQEPWHYQPANDAIGRIYTYERSNTDGSLDERVAVFRRDATHIEVYKENGLCRNAAFVSAELDFATLSAPVITGGQLRPNAEHMDFAFLEWDQAAAQLNIHVQLPNMEMREDAPVPSTPWHLFDFDLASLTVMTPHLSAPEDGFEFGMALVWADPSASDPLVWMGDVSAHYTGDGSHEGVETRHYRLDGTALEGENATGGNGDLWLDRNDGHIVEAVLPAPNHPGYTDFRLRLLGVSDGGQAEWTRLLTAHFENCDD